MPSIGGHWRLLLKTSGQPLSHADQDKETAGAEAEGCQQLGDAMAFHLLRSLFQLIKLLLQMEASHNISSTMLAVVGPVRGMGRAIHSSIARIALAHRHSSTLARSSAGDLHSSTLAVSSVGGLHSSGDAVAGQGSFFIVHLRTYWNTCHRCAMRLQEAYTRAEAVRAAADGAFAPVLPALPAAVGGRVTDARAVANLLRIAPFADLTSTVGLHHDSSETLALAATFVTRTPHFPLTPHAIRKLAGVAGRIATGLSFYQRIIAELAAILRLCQDGPLSVSLTRATGGGTALPGFPTAQLTINRRSAKTIYTTGTW
mmetsp:Transcript_48353/g.76911  ORF Transcript_48353/g.76911 Transcript_48353/m.76911 type:complete len:315 (-) Transcript_48353:1855-2799(-)